ncbi:MAG: FhaA domain-containing protein [Pyrinomonadaceae bacterium]
MSVLEKVRRWIDGESAELVLENAARDAQVKPRSQSEEFIVKIARAIETVMQNEMLPLPQGTTIIPSEYTIFLNADDDKEWQGVKRRGLEQGLYHILAERAREIAGKKKLETKSFVLELRIDATLEKGEVRVQHSWEDSTSNKTGVLARPKPAPAPAQEIPKPVSARKTNPNVIPPPSDYLPPLPSRTGFETVRRDAENIPPTFDGKVEKVAPISSDEGEEMTNVRPRVAELYKLEIWMNNIRQNIVPIFNKEVVVGRGSRSRPVDIALSGDPEISRRHLTIATDGAGNFWAVNEGRNPAMIGSYEIAIGQRVPLKPGVPLAVGTYTLRIQPR